MPIPLLSQSCYLFDVRLSELNSSNVAKFDRLAVESPILFRYERALLRDARPTVGRIQLGVTTSELTRTVLGSNRISADFQFNGFTLEIFTVPSKWQVSTLPKIVVPYDRLIARGFNYAALG